MEDGERELVNLMSSRLSGKMKSKKQVAPRVLVGGVKQVDMKEKEEELQVLTLQVTPRRAFPFRMQVRTCRISDLIQPFLKIQIDNFMYAVAVI